jgi:diacylglycerol O-acyltransferase / wax synthase
MERLSGLDASFLYIESVSQPQHVCSILEVDTSTIPGGYSFEGLRDELTLRIAAIPEFRAKLADSQLNLDYPVWVDDEAFDLDRHLFRIGLPSPGGRRELAEICGHITTEPLDRGKPLWEMWVIEGIADTDPHAGGLLAVMTKVHHAAVDGVTGANLLSQLCSLEPEVSPPELVEGPGKAGVLEIAAGGLVRFATRPLQLVNVIPTTAATVVKTLRRARSGMTMAAPFAAPATRFNAALSARRNVAFAQLDIDDIKTIKDRFNVTVNDVVMALCAAVLRWFLSDHAELPDKSLVAMVPVSVHDKCDRSGHNQLSGMFCRLETHIGDPAQRLTAIARADAVAKDHSSVINPTLLQDWTQLAARAVFGAVFRLVANMPLIGNPVYNLIISNVPGPQATLYFLGCEVKAIYPLGPLFHGCGLNVTVMSLNGKLNVGVISCPDLVPDLWRIADGFEVALEELLDCAAPARL